MLASKAARTSAPAIVHGMDIVGVDIADPDPDARAQMSSDGKAPRKQLLASKAARTSAPAIVHGMDIVGVDIADPDAPSRPYSPMPQPFASTMLRGWFDEDEDKSTVVTTTYDSNLFGLSDSSDMFGGEEDVTSSLFECNVVRL